MVFIGLGNRLLEADNAKEAVGDQDQDHRSLGA